MSRWEMGDGRLNHLTPALSPSGAGECVSAAWQIYTDKSFLHEKFGLRGRTVGADAVFDGDDAGFVFAKRDVNQSVVGADVAVDDGKVFFDDGARFPDFAEFARDDGIFGDEDEAGGFAVEAVDEVGCGGS